MKKILVVVSALVVIVGASIFFVSCKSKKKDNLNNIGKDLTNYFIDIEYDDESKSALSVCEIDYCNNTDAMLKDVKLHLYISAFCKNATKSCVGDTSYDSCFYNGESYATLNITRAWLNGVDLIPTYEGEDNDIMVAVLPQSLYPTERVNIKVEYSFTLPNCNHRFGYGENTVNFGNFYPVVCAYNDGWVTDGYSANGDPFCSEMSNYYANISADSDLTLASTGVVNNSTVDEGKTFYNIEALCVRDFAFVLGKNFQTASCDYNGVTITYYYTSDASPEKALDCAKDSIKTFSDLFYVYPYSTYNVVQADFCYGGMEYPNLSIISNEIENYDDYLNVIVHETAHQWWYNLVGNDQFNQPWLDEALTEFSTVLFYDYNEGYAFKHKDMVSSAHENYVFFTNVYKNVLGEIDSTIDKPIDEFSTEPEYSFVVYCKGMLMFDSLYNLVGKNNFIKSIKSYAQNNVYDIAYKEDLIGCFEDNCDTNLENFFDCWLNGKVIIN